MSLCMDKLLKKKGYPGFLPVMKGKTQKILEEQGCVFRGQELLANHELDLNKKCYCGRPKKWINF